LREGSTSFLKKRSKKLFESGSGVLSWASKYPNKPVMPAKAGIHDFLASPGSSVFVLLTEKSWMPAFAGMTGGEQAAAEIRSFVISIVFNISYGFSFALF